MKTYIKPAIDVYDLVAENALLHTSTRIVDFDDENGIDDIDE